MKVIKDLELLIDGIIHMIDVTINGDGSLHYDAVCKDNGIDNCDPTPLTPAIEEATKEALKEDIEAIAGDYHSEMTSASAKGRNYLINC